MANSQMNKEQISIELYHPDHLEDLRKSRLSDEAILEAGIKTVPPRDISKKLGFDIPGLTSMYEISYPNCDGYSRFKAFYADGEGYYKDGSRKPKYLARKDSSNHLYIPPRVKPILNDLSTPLYITEGEKKSLKACQEGLYCIAIAGLWNWKVKDKDELISDYGLISLDGRTVYIVPDSHWQEPDRHGNQKNLRQAVNGLARQLINRGAKVFLVELPKGDIEVKLDDYLCNHTVEEFMKLPSHPVTEVTEVTVVPEKEIQVLDFPIDVFPVGLKKMVLDVSNSMGVPSAVTSSIVLTILGAAIGNAVKISPKPTFEVTPFLWTCIVMPTGSSKSPLLELLTKPIKSRQAAAYRRHKNELRQYQLSLRAFKKNESDELLDEPIFEQYLINDSTVEALSAAFEGQPRGLLSVQDELASWLLGMNQYKGSGNDRQAYLQLFNSGSWSINRKSGVKFIPSTGLGIVGNIQPETIPLVFDKNALDDGLIQRILFVYPDIQPMKFNRHSIDNLYLWDDILSWCYQIPITTDDNGFVIPKILRIEGAGLDAYEQFYNEYGASATILPARYRGFISKLFLYCLKFAGILHVVQGYGSDLGGNIAESVVTDAIKLTKFYFGQISLILKLYERNAKTVGESQNRLIYVLYDLRDDVDKGMLRLETIVDKYNKGLPTNFQLTSEKVASILKNELGLVTQKSTGNHSYLIWEDEKLKKYFKQTVTTVTTVTEKAEKRERVTEVTVVTDESEENFEELCEFFEQKRIETN